MSGKIVVRLEIEISSDVDAYTVRHWTLQDFYGAIENGDGKEIVREVREEPDPDR